MIFFPEIPEGGEIPFIIGVTVLLIICKFTYFPQLPWLFCLFLIWFPLLILAIMVVGLIIWTIIKDIFESI